MKKSILVTGLILIFLQSCSDSDDNPFLDSVCDQITKVDNNRYKNTQSEDFSVRSLNITGDCLEVQIESSGCSGDTWKVDLIDAGRVAESYPEQRDVKLLLDNEELCDAIVIKTYSFDLRPVRTGNNVVLLNLELWGEQIRYEY